MSSCRGFLVLACVTGALAPTSPAAAAACCVSATQGAGRLLIWEELAVGITTGTAFGVGYWDENADWHGYGDFAEIEWRSEIWAWVALGERTSAFLGLPAMLTYREAVDVHGLGGGLADIQLAFRYELLAIGELLELPAVAIIASVLAPTGRSMQDATASLGADTTGRGAWVLSLGTSIEKTRLPFFLQLNLSTSLPLPAERSDLGVSQRFGPGLQSSLAGGIEAVPDELVLSLVGRFAWEAPLSIDGSSVDNSSRRDLGAGLAISWRFDPHWTVQAAADLGLFVDGLGDNQPGRITTTIGLRYGYF